MGVRGLAPGVRVVHTVFRPFPLEPISGRRVFYVSTAPNSALALMAEYLGREHGGGKVIGTSNRLADRRALRADLEEIAGCRHRVGRAEGGAVNLVVKTAVERGMDVTFCDNRWFPPEETARSASWPWPPPSRPWSGSQ
ncbi:MAG: hypothetical protein LC799_04470 [Actinobacteria bacterium]|nr:hypothetical protein [Actinomycetota bacterium]